MYCPAASLSLKGIAQQTKTHVCPPTGRFLREAETEPRPPHAQICSPLAEIGTVAPPPKLEAVQSTAGMLSPSSTSANFFLPQPPPPA